MLCSFILSSLTSIFPSFNVGLEITKGKVNTQEEVIKYSASGFRDFTRIAASDPVMWRDIFLHNKDAVLEMLQRYSEDLTALQRAIRHGQGDVLEEHFTKTRAIRRSIIDAKQAGQFSPTEASDEDRPDWLSIY